MTSPLDVLLGAQVKDDGVPVTPRRYIDFRTGLTLVDDPSTDSIRVSASGGGGGVLVGDVNGDSDDNVVTRITGDAGDVEMVADSLSWGSPGSSQLKVNAVDGAIELWNNAALALKAHSSSPTIANSGSITQIIGGVRHTVRTISSNVALDATTKDFVGWVDASAPRTITLPVPSSGRTFLLVNVGASAVTIARNASELINGVAANYVVPFVNCIVQIVSNGTDWFALPIFDGTAAFVPSSRTISTTAPLTGGGDLSANRTLAISNATTGAVGVVRLTQDLGGTGAAPTVLGLTGTANVVAMHGTAILSDAGAGGRLNFSSTGLDVPAGTFSAGSNTAKVVLDSYGAFGATFSSIWLGVVVPDVTNAALAGDGTTNSVNAITKVQVAAGGTPNANFTATGLRVGDGTTATEKLDVVGRAKIGVDAGKVYFDSLIGSTATWGAAWLGVLTPSATNYVISSNGSNNTIVNSPGTILQLSIGGTAQANVSPTGLRVGDSTVATEKLDVVGRAKIGVNTGKVIIDSDLNGATTAGGIWMGTATPTAGNCNIRGTVADLIFNASAGHTFQIGGAGKAYITTTGLRVGSGVAPTEVLDVTGAIKGSTTITLGTNPAASGTVRLPNNSTVVGRNSTNSGDVTLIGVNTSNEVAVGTTVTNNQLGGGQRWQTRSVSANLTIDTTTRDTIVLVDSTAATRQITLPAPTDGRMLIIKRKAGTNPIEILRGSANIDGVAEDWELVSDGGGGTSRHPFIELTSDGTGWFILASHSIQEIAP